MAVDAGMNRKGEEQMPYMVRWEVAVCAKIQVTGVNKLPGNG